jgi:hypothetical protein
MSGSHDDHHGDDHHGDHHHGDRGPSRDHHERRGPEGTEFLQVEMSKVLAAEAYDMARDAARDILREAIRERVRERVGDRLVELARIVADDLVDDFEANLAIEGQIEARKASRAATEEKLRAALAKKLLHLFEDLGVGQRHHRPPGLAELLARYVLEPLHERGRRTQRDLGAGLLVPVRRRHVRLVGRRHRQVQLSHARPRRRRRAVGDARELHGGRRVVHHLEVEALLGQPQAAEGVGAHPVPRDRPGPRAAVNRGDLGERAIGLARGRGGGGARRERQGEREAGDEVAHDPGSTV